MGMSCRAPRAGYFQVRSAVWAFAVLAILQSCNLSMIGAPVLSRAKDATAPDLVISTPAEGYACANVVFVSGSVSDKTSDGKAGSVTGLAYEVPGTGVSGNVALKGDGSFSFSFRTDTLGNGGFSLVVRAVDWNSNVALSRLNLRKDTASSLPSFRAEAGSQSITLTWDEVDQTASYDLYYTDNGSQPSDTPSVTDIASPFTLKCDNGNLYVMRLRARAKPGFADSYSDYLMAIPLSAQTLTPQVYGMRRKIDLVWNGIAATNEYTIFRRVGDSGSFDEFRNVIGTSFSDTTVQDGRCYYYKVRPKDNCPILSAAAGTQTDGFMYGPSKEERYGVDDRDICWNGTYMYAASYTKGLKVYDATDPANPALLRTIAMPSADAHIFQIAINGNFAYVAAGKAGLLIYDLSSPANPVLKASYTTGITCARGVTVAGSTVVVADFTFTSTDNTNAKYDSTLKVLDVGTVTDPSPNLLKTFRLDSPSDTVTFGYLISEDLNPINMAIIGTYVLVADRGSGLKVVNLGDADGSGPRQTVSPAGAEAPVNNANAIGLALCGSYAYVTVYSYGIMVVDLSLLATQGTVSSKYCDGYTSGSGRVVDIKSWGDWLYVANFERGVQVFKQDTSADSTLDLRMSLPARFPSSIRPKGALAFVTTGLSYEGSYSQIIVDTNLPLELKQVATVQMSAGASCQDIAIAGNHAFVAAGSAGLRIYDMSVPEEAREIGHLNFPGYRADSVKVTGGMAAICAKKTSYPNWPYVFIVDVSDPTSPKAYSSPITAAYYRGMALSGNYFYLTDLYNGIQIYDVSGPMMDDYVSPVKTIDTFGSIQDVSIQGTHLLAAYSGKNVDLYDIFNPVEAYLCGSVAIPASVHVITGKTGLFTAHSEDAVYSCDITDPLNASAAVSFAPPTFDDNGYTRKKWQPKGIAHTGNYLFSFLYPYDHYPNEGGRIEVIDVTKPGKPAMLQSFPFPMDTYAMWNNAEGWGQSNGLAVSGPYLYLAFGDKGLYVYKFRP